MGWGGAFTQWCAAGKALICLFFFAIAERFFQNDVTGLFFFSFFPEAQ